MVQAAHPLCQLGHQPHARIPHQGTPRTAKPNPCGPRYQLFSATELGRAAIPSLALKQCKVEESCGKKRCRGVLVVRLPVEVAVEGTIVQLTADGAEDLAAESLALMCISASLSTGWLAKQLIQWGLHPPADL